MGVASIIFKVVTLKPVETLISVGLGKLLRRGKGGSKVSMGAAVSAVVAGLIVAVKVTDPGLGELLAGHEAALIGAVGLAQAVIMYYRKEENL